MVSTRGWRTDMASFIEKQQVFFAKDVVQHAEKIGVSKRSADSFMSDFIKKGVIHRIHAGFYVTDSLAQQSDVALKAVACKAIPSSVISLDSVFNPAIDDRVVVVSPRLKSNPSYRTPFGDVIGHTISTKMNHALLGMGFSKESVYSRLPLKRELMPTHSNEVALLNASYLAAIPFVDYSPTTQVSDDFLNRINPGVLGSMFHATGLPSDSLAKICENPASSVINQVHLHSQPQQEQESSSSPSP